MLNVVAIMGRLVADPELRTTPQGINVCSFRIACDRNFARQGEQRQADFIDIVAWRSQAEFVSKYFQKGSLLPLTAASRPASIRTRMATTARLLRSWPTTSTLQAPRTAMQAAEQIIRILLRPTRTQPLPVRPLWRQLPAIPPAMPMTLPSSTTATTCRSDTKRSIR